MALRDQPYLPLYVQDLLTDEKLMECSAAAHGIYLRLLCILHKQDKYGLLCLKQKHKQNESKIVNFALFLARQMPFEAKQIEASLQELSDEGVIIIEEDTLFQKRMLKDGEVSLIRAEVGKSGGSSVTKQYGIPGFLYWFTDYENQNKIGISVNPQNRIYRIRSDFKLKKFFIERVIEVNDMGKSEDEALLFFNGKRDGEWLTIPYMDIKPLFALLEAKLKAKPEATREIENDNEDVFGLGERREGVGEKKEGSPFPGFPLSSHLNGLPEIKVGAVIELVQITKQKKVTKGDVIGMWEVFKVQNLTGKKFYQDEGAVHSHFINWIKSQDFQKTGFPKNKADPMEDDARRILKSVNKK